MKLSKNLQIKAGANSLYPYVTMSAGVATIVPEVHRLPVQLIAAADKMLYEAKTKGRDRVMSNLLAQQPVSKTLSQQNIPSPRSISPAEPIISEQDLLQNYVAYFVSRGASVHSPLEGTLAFSERVYEYKGYSHAFLAFWNHLCKLNNFEELSLEGDIHHFSEFSHGECTIHECSRCSLPIAVPTGQVYDIVSCNLCLVEEGSNIPEIKPTEISSENTGILVIGESPTDNIQAQQWLANNGFEVYFSPDPTALGNPHWGLPIELMIITADLSKNQVQEWEQQLRTHSALKPVPLIALSEYAGSGMPWLNRSVEIADYILPPFNGVSLIRHLNRLSKSRSPNQEHHKSQIFWFPR